MKGTTAVAAAAAILATTVCGAARADLVANAIPSDLSDPTSAMPQTGWCDATSCGGATGHNVVFSSFTLASESTITSLVYYSYFDNSAYASTAWSFWTGDGPSLTPYRSDSATVVGTVTNVTGDLWKIEVDNLHIVLNAGTYWIGLQNTITPGSDPNKPSNSLVAAGFDDKPADLYYVGEANGTLDTAIGPAAFDLVGTANTPEPSTWAMMLAGFAGLAWAGRRRLSRRAA